MRGLHEREPLFFLSSSWDGVYFFFPSDRDVISRVDDSTVTQSWEISNRVRETETERCRVNKGIPVVRGMPYIFIPCTHTYTASDHSTTPPLLPLLLLATMKKKNTKLMEPAS